MDGFGSFRRHDRSSERGLRSQRRTSVLAYTPAGGRPDIPAGDIGSHCFGCDDHGARPGRETRPSDGNPSALHPVLAVFSVGSRHIVFDGCH